MKNINKYLAAAFSLAALLIVAVIGFGISASVKIAELKSQVRGLKNVVEQSERNYHNSVANGLNNIKNEIQKQLEEQSKNYYNAKYTLKSINADERTAEVEVLFSLKTVPSNSLVLVKASANSDADADELNAQVVSSASYKADFVLSLDSIYKISYVTESEDFIKSEELLEINLNQSLRDRFKVSSSFSSSKKDVWQFDFIVGNNYQNNENFKISNINIDFVLNDSKIKTFDATAYSNPTEKGYQQFSAKSIEFNVSEINFKDPGFKVVITITDNYGLSYIYGK